MRPLRLTMQAFGPFVGREVVDFRDATSAGLFGVYGPTGAGKSTIFSAMTFALFGEAAKEEQEIATLRSDYAAQTIITEVELVFDIADRRYVVRRRPEQMRPKQRGAGETRVPHEAWLFDATGMPLDKITADQAGKVLAEKKASTVGVIIEELLGYGAQQFRQIVLLPQGQFEKFLAAKTDARLVILRELFDVSLYRGLAAKMKVDAAAIERQVRDQRAFCEGRLQAEGFENGDALKLGVEAAQALSIQHTKEEGQAITAAKTAGDAVSAADSLEQKFVAHETAKAALASLVSQESEFGKLGDLNQKVRRAEAMQESERTLLEAEQEFAGAVEAVGKAITKTAEASQAKEDAATKLQLQQGREPERAGLRTEIQQLHLHQTALASTGRLATDAKEATDQAEKATKAFVAGETLHKRRESALTTATQAVEAARKSEVKTVTLGAELARLQAEEAATKSFEQKERDLTVAAAALADVSAKATAAAQAVQAAQQRYSEAERQLAEVQALHLAAKLVPGEACPVCGGIDHPKPATGHIEHAGLDEAFRKARIELEKATKARELAEINLGGAKARKTLLEGSLVDLERPQRALSDVRASLETARLQLAALGAPEAVPEAEQKLKDAQQERDKARTSLDALQNAKTTAATSVTQATAKLGQALSAIPEGLRQQAALEQAIEHAGRKLKAAEAALQRAEALERTTREAALSADKDFESATARLNESQRRRDLATQRFSDRLVENGLNKEEFSALKPSIATVRESEQRVEAFNSRLEIGRANAKAAETAVENVIRPDVLALQQARDECTGRAQAAIDKRARTAARREHLTKLQSELTTIMAALTELEENSNALRTLALLFNAENEQRLDLETFAIGAMFDQVIDAANQRLGPMTNGRFTLERELDGIGGRSRRGLGLKVQDLFTGKARATSTLSGGETFIAALSLALGLSDVVERTNGRVRLDTIFIDEGFGSLDAENEAGTLDQVLQVLTRLVSEHRSVGLVSHVPLVQEAVPNGFYVRKGMQGSRVETRRLS